MTHKEFLDYLAISIGKIIKIDGPVVDYERPRGERSVDESLGVLLKVYRDGSGLPTGRTEISAGNIVALVDVLIGGKTQTLWVSAKRVCILSNSTAEI